MNYKVIYENIIKNAIAINRNKNGDCYFENHHIMPKCLGGNDEKENLVLLTAREHFICHKLLTYMYKNNAKIYYAFHMMTFMNKRKYICSSRDYASATELFKSIPVSSEIRNKISASNKISHKGLKLSEEHKQHIGISNKGIKRTDEQKKNYKGFIGKHSEESKKKMRKPRSANAKKNMSQSKIGNIPWNKGMKMSEDFCNKTKEGIKNNKK